MGLEKLLRSGSFWGVKSLGTSNMEIIWGLPRVSDRHSGSQSGGNSRWRSGWFSLGEDGGLALVGWGIPRIGVFRFSGNGQGKDLFEIS